MNLIIEVLKNVVLITLITLPPWIMLISVMKKSKSRKQKRFLAVAFVLYILISIFTDTVLPTIVAIMYMRIIYSSNKYENEKYYLRPLKRKKYKLSLNKSTYTITIASERLKIIGMSLIFKIIGLAFSLWFIVILNAYSIEVSEQEIIKEFLTSTPLKAVYLAVLMVIAAPITEEFIFRHLFYRILKNRTGKIISAILTSLLFTVLHYNIAGAVLFFTMGLFNCYLYEKYGYRAAVLNHMVFNLLSLIGLLFIQ